MPTAVLLTDQEDFSALAGEITVPTGMGFDYRILTEKQQGTGMLSPRNLSSLAEACHGHDYILIHLKGNFIIFLVQHLLQQQELDRALFLIIESPLTGNEVFRTEDYFIGQAVRAKLQEKGREALFVKPFLLKSYYKSWLAPFPERLLKPLFLPETALFRFLLQKLDTGWYLQDDTLYVMAEGVFNLRSYWQEHFHRPSFMLAFCRQMAGSRFPGLAFCRKVICLATLESFFRQLDHLQGLYLLVLPPERANPEKNSQNIVYPEFKTTPINNLSL